MASLSAAIASQWESDNEADEEELERERAKNARILKMRMAKLQKDRRKKAIQIELVAREKELKLVRRAEKLAQRYLDCGKREIDQFTKELQISNKNAIKLPSECVDAVMKELTGKKMDCQAALRRCKRHVSEVRNGGDTPRAVRPRALSPMESLGETAVMSGFCFKG